MATNQIGFTINIGNLPEGWEGTPQEILDKVAELLDVKFDDEIAIFKTGTTEPDSLTNQAWLRNGNEWYVPDENGNWVPVEVDDRLKRIYVRNGDPFVGADSDEPRERSLWLRTNSAGNEAKELSVYLNGAWRSIYLLSDLVDLQDRMTLAEEQIDSVIETAEDGLGLKKDTVGFDQVTDNAKDSLREYYLDLDTLNSISGANLENQHKIYIFVPSAEGLNRLRGVTIEELGVILQQNLVLGHEYNLFYDRKTSGEASTSGGENEWLKMDVNESVVLETDGAELITGDVIRLPEGKYRADIHLTRFQSGSEEPFRVKGRLRRVSPFAETVLNGTMSETRATAGRTSYLEGTRMVGEFTINQESDFEIQAYVSNPFQRPGWAGPQDPNVFTIAQFWKLP